MGFLSDMVSASKAKPRRTADDPRQTWRSVFQSKEDGMKDRPEPTRGGGSYTRSAATQASFTRLLQAMRSMAPGGWTDDRWEQSRHFSGIPYVAIHRCGEQMAQAEFQVFHEDPDHPDGKRPVKRDDPAEGGRLVKPWDLVELLKRPNDEDSFGDMMYRWNQQLDLTGSALTWMVPNKLGTPMELYVVPTATAIPQPASNPDFPHGFYRIQPLYPYGPFSQYPTPNSAVGAPIPSQWMLRFQYPHPFLRYEGYSPMTALRFHLDSVDMMDRSRQTSMRRSINPSAVLQMDDMESGMSAQLDDMIERVRAEFEAVHQGPENQGQLFVSAPGTRLESWGARPVDMDYQAGWDQLVNFLLGGFGITKPAAGMIEDSSYSTLFATLKQLYWLTLEPKTNRIASKLTRRLAPFFGDNLIIEIRCKPINDHEVKQAKCNLLMSAKAITKNEIRKEMDLEITEEEWGDEIAGSESKEEQPEGANGQGPPPGMPGAPPQGPPAQEAPKAPDQPAQEEPDAGGDLLSSLGLGGDRPTPGSLGEGALGPRKGMSSLRARYKFRGLNGVHLNGHAKG